MKEREKEQMMEQVKKLNDRTVLDEMNGLMAFLVEKLRNSEAANLQLQAALGQAMREASAAAGEVKRLQAELDALKAAPTAAPAAEAA